MSRCDRYDAEGLLLVQQGRTLPPHFAHCPECRTAAAAYRQIVSALSSLHEDAHPRTGWQSRVLGQVSSRPSPRRRWSTVAVPVAAAALLTFGVYITWNLAPSTSPTSSGVQAPGLSTALVPGDLPTTRGVDARPGDRLQLRGERGEFRHAEIRVYLNDRAVVLRCGDSTPCRAGDSTLEAELVMDVAGTYQPVLLLSWETIPPPGDSLDEDTARLQQDGGRVILDLPVEAR